MNTEQQNNNWETLKIKLAQRPSLHGGDMLHLPHELRELLPLPTRLGNAFGQIERLTQLTETPNHPTCINNTFVDVSFTKIGENPTCIVRYTPHEVMHVQRVIDTICLTILKEASDGSVAYNTILAITENMKPDTDLLLADEHYLRDAVEALEQYALYFSLE